MLVTLQLSSSVLFFSITPFSESNMRQVHKKNALEIFRTMVTILRLPQYHACEEEDGQESMGHLSEALTVP